MTLHLFPSLRWRPYRLLWISGALSRSAQVGMTVLTAWQAFQLGGNDLVAVVTFASMLTFALATPIGGLLADACDRRLLVVLAQGTAGAATGALALLSLGHLLQPPELIGLTWIAGAARGVEIAAAQSFLPRLVPGGDLLNAVSLNGVTTYGARFVGPTLVGPFLAGTVSAPLIGRAYLMLTVLYGAAVWHAARVDRAAGVPETGRQPVAGMAGQLAGGLRYLLGSSAALVLLVVVTAHCALTMSYDALLPQIAQQVLHGNGATYSSLSADTGIGAIIGTLAIAALGPGQSRTGALLLTALGSGLTPALLAVAGTPLVAGLAAGAIGGTQAAFMVLMLAVLLDLVPDDLRGRASGLFLMANAGMMALANLVLGVIAADTGPALPLALPGLAFAALFAVGVVLWPDALHRVTRPAVALAVPPETA
jgi:MFS family permease